MASPFIIAGCGGASGGNNENKENSASEVAVQVQVQPTAADQGILSNVTKYSDTKREANWIPEGLTTNNKLFTKKQATSTPANPTVIEKIVSNGDNIVGWSVYDTDPSGATVTSIPNAERGGNVIHVDGSGIENGYLMGYSWADDTSWNDTENRTIKWSMNFSEDYMIYVRVSTRKGYRYLYYTPHNANYGIAENYDAGHYIHNGLGTTSSDGTWRTFSRNLTADLKRHEPDNAITSVDGFYVRGSGLIDDVELLAANTQHINEVIYEDGEDGKTTRWSVYDQNPSGATISNENKSIKLAGSGLENGYILGAWDNNKGWKNTINKEISWDMNYNENYVIYLSVETDKGHRFITYSALSQNTFKNNPNYQEKVVEGEYTYLHLGLNPNTKGGSLQTVTRNLELDLKRFENDNSLISVNAFLVRGSGVIDNVKMFDTNGDGDYINTTN
jgi:hypothetical protein